MKKAFHTTFYFPSILKTFTVQTHVSLVSRVWLFEAPWTIACQAPLSVEFSRQEYWSGLPFPNPGDLPDPGMEPGSPALQADSLPSVSQSVQSLSRVQLFVTPWTAARQASLSITNSRSLPKPMSIELVMPSSHLILCRPLILLPSLPSETP